MNKNQNRKINEVVKRLSSLDYVEAVILFGSYARGSARKDSDIDLAVITEKINSEEETAIIGESDRLFDVWPFHRLPIILQFRVLKEGKILFCRNSKIIYETKVKVFRNYLDFEPFINRFYNRVIKDV